MTDIKTVSDPTVVPVPQDSDPVIDHRGRGTREIGLLLAEVVGKGGDCEYDQATWVQDFSDRLKKVEDILASNADRMHKTNNVLEKVDCAQFIITIVLATVVAPACIGFAPGAGAASSMITSASVGVQNGALLAQGACEITTSTCHSILGGAEAEIIKGTAFGDTLKRLNTQSMDTIDGIAKAQNSIADAVSEINRAAKVVRA